MGRGTPGSCSDDMTCSMDGSLHLRNDGGTWDGEYVGWIAAGGVYEATSWMRGSGDYEGWSYIVYMNGYDDDSSADMHGLLYRGDLPPSVALDDATSPVR